MWSGTEKTIQLRESQLENKDVYQELKGKIEGPLHKIIKSVIRKVRNNSKLGRFYLPPKIHQRLYNIPGRPVISNSGYYTENISALLEYNPKPIMQNV